MRSPLLALLVGFASLSVTNAQGTVNSTATTTTTTVASSTTVPFFSAPIVGSSLPSGPAPIPGSVTSIINSEGAGSFTDTFAYTLPQETVSPTGNVTLPATGSASNLQPNPTNLQVVGSAPTLKGSLGQSLSVAGVLVAGLAGGMYLV